MAADILNAGTADDRLDALEGLVRSEAVPVKTGYVNNHIHTFYSFSPYSPAKAVWTAYRAGLTTAGIMDHDSVAGCREFIRAGEITGIATTIGMEMRFDMSKTALGGRRFNNPDQAGIAYVALHAIPHGRIGDVADFARPYSVRRNARNREMTARINGVSPLKLDFDADILPLSKAGEGGSVTERHILYALALKILDTGEDVPEFLKRCYGIAVSGDIAGYLADKGNPFIDYDLLGVLKSSLLGRVYVDAADECPDVSEGIRLARETGAVAAYAYLGDVGVSATGDKKPQKFEDGFIEPLFDELARIGFDAVTYMPTRNTIEQLRRVKALCRAHGLMEISGEDINSPRQSFICKALDNPEFSNLTDSTWALIRRERGLSGRELP